MNPDVTAFVLAGGKSSRMGEDKAFLSLGSQTLLERALQLAATVGDVRIVGEAGKFGRFRPVVEDIYPERGPLGAIHAALCRTQTELNLMLAVDLPFVPGTFLCYLVREAEKSQATVTLPRVTARLQPLCAVYRREFAEVADNFLQAGKNKIDASFQGLRIRVMDEQELTEQGFTPGMFRNLNTREEWESAQKEWGFSVE